MKLIIILSITALAVAAPLDDSKTATILRYENENFGTGGYKFDFETSDGISRQENGQLQNEGTDEEAIVVQGSYSYTGPDGVQYTVTYTADADGFHVEGAHIPESHAPGVGALPPGALASLVG